MTAHLRIGNINLPTDKRQIPLVTVTADSDGPSESLALAAVTAYEDAIDRKPKTRDKQRIVSAVRDDEFVFASFIPESNFQKIPIQQLFNGLENALRLCRGRIVIIGGNWHSDLGHGERVDTYETPVGPMAGMYLHANYIEALLDDRYQPASLEALWRRWLGRRCQGCWRLDQPATDTMSLFVVRTPVNW